MSGLPSFFHQKGKTVLDELADYELGGDSDEEIDGIIDDTGFDDGYGGSDLELPSFFQPTTRPSDQLSNIGNVSTVDSDGSLLNSDSVNLSSLLNNFAWLGKGNINIPNKRVTRAYNLIVAFVLHFLTSAFALFLIDVGPQSASPAQKSDSAFLNGLPSSNLSASKQNNVLAPPGVAPNPMPTPQSMSPQKYSEILAQNDRAPLDRQSSIPFPGQLQQYVMPPLGPDGSSRMNMSSNGMPLVTPYAMPMPMPMPMQMHHSQPPYPPSFRGPPSHFVNGPNGPMPPPPNMHFYHHPPNFPQQSPLHPMQQQQQQQQQQHQFEVPFRSSTEVSRGPPSADPRLNTTGPRDQTPTFQEPQEMLQQMLQQLQQPPPPSTPPPVQSSILQRLAVDPNVDARMHHAPPVDRGRTQMFQQMAVTTAGPGITPSVGYPKSEMMTSSDVRFVVNKVVSPLETNDPYSEDYYFLQVCLHNCIPVLFYLNSITVKSIDRILIGFLLCQLILLFFIFYYIFQSNYKKNAKKAEAAMLAGEPIPHPVYLPFPAWLETKNRIASHLEDKRKLFGDRSMEWEEKEQVRKGAAKCILF